MALSFGTMASFYNFIQARLRTFFFFCIAEQSFAINILYVQRRQPSVYNDKKKNEKRTWAYSIDQCIINVIFVVFAVLSYCC